MRSIIELYMPPHLREADVNSALIQYHNQKQHNRLSCTHLTTFKGIRSVCPSINEAIPVHTFTALDTLQIIHHRMIITVNTFSLHQIWRVAHDATSRPLMLVMSHYERRPEVYVKPCAVSPANVKWVISALWTSTTLLEKSKLDHFSHLRTNRVFNAHNTDAGQVIQNLSLVVPVWLCCEVPHGYANGP